MKTSQLYLTGLFFVLACKPEGVVSQDQQLAQDAAEEVVLSSQELSELSLTTEVAAEATLQAAGIGTTPEEIAAAVGDALNALVAASPADCEAIITVNGAAVTAAWGNAAGCTFGTGSQAVTLTGQSVLTVSSAQANEVVFDIDSAAQVRDTTLSASTVLTINPINQNITLDRDVTVTRGAESLTASASGDATLNGDTLTLNLTRQLEAAGAILRTQTLTDLTVTTGVLFPTSGVVSFNNFKGRSVEISFTNDGGDEITVEATLDGQRESASFSFLFNTTDQTFTAL